MDEFGQNNPYDQSNEPTVNQHDAPAGPNVLGIIGFILALTCVLSPVGLLMSLVALTKPRKGFAIAGTIIGLILTLVVGGITFLGIREFSNPAFKARFETESDFRMIQQAINASAAVPATLDDPALNLPAEVKTDYWGTPYGYSEDGAGNWTLTTYGPDTKPGGGDDAAIPGDAGMFDSAQSLDAVYEQWKSSMRDTPDEVQSNSSDSPEDAPTDPPADPEPDNAG